MKNPSGFVLFSRAPDRMTGVSLRNIVLFGMTQYTLDLLDDQPPRSELPMDANRIWRRLFT